MMLVLGGFVALVVAVVIGWLRRVHRRIQTTRQLELSYSRGLPGAVVLLQIAVGGGSHPRQALGTVACLPTSSGPLDVVTRELAHIHERLELGADLTSVMLTTDTRSGDGSRVLDALRRAEVDGGPLAIHLEVLVADLRRQRRTALDASAQRLTVSMLFPLVLCILPAFVLLAVVPLVQAALAGLPS